MGPVYRAVAAIVKGVLSLMRWRLSVAGASRIPADGAAVLACNHVSYLDPVMLGCAADRRGRAVRFLAKEELFSKPGFGWLLRTVRQIPVDRYGHPEHVLGPAVSALREGHLVGMFPESTISVSFVPGNGKTGAARIAMDAGVPLVPVALWGGQRISTKNRRLNLQRGVALTVRVGEPVPYEEDEDPKVVTKRLMAALSELVDEESRSYPQAPAGPDDRWWVPHHLGGTAPTVSEASEARRRQDATRRRGRARRRSGKRPDG